MTDAASQAQAAALIEVANLVSTAMRVHARLVEHFSKQMIAALQRVDEALDEAESPVDFDEILLDPDDASVTTTWPFATRCPLCRDEDASEPEDPRSEEVILRERIGRAIRGIGIRAGEDSGFSSDEAGILVHLRDQIAELVEDGDL